MPPKKQKVTLGHGGTVIPIIGAEAADEQFSSSQETSTHTVQTSQKYEYEPAHRLGGRDDGSSRSSSPEENDLVLICKFNTTIVGIQYYQGLVNVGESVLLQREPQNPYDPNAIQVLNIGGTQVGHIKRQVAAKLAPMMDANEIKAEGITTQGNITGNPGFTLLMILHFYGDPSRTEELMQMLEWTTPGQRGFTARDIKALNERVETAADQTDEMRALTNDLEQLSARRQADLLDKLYGGEVDLSLLPLHPCPPGIGLGLNVNLLPFQSQGLAWMIKAEHPMLPIGEDDPQQFWIRKTESSQTFYLNALTSTPVKKAPVLARGGILSDDMGLGKTLQMISLILADVDGKPIVKQAAKATSCVSKATLIVCPLSVMENWVGQINAHVEKGRLSVCVYHGAGKRSLTATGLAAYDVVVTTYQTIAGEFQSATGEKQSHSKKRKSEQSAPLMEVFWRRVILDEGHKISNPKAFRSKGCFHLKAERRWIASGTPISNQVEDLYSMLHYLKFVPLSEKQWFRRLLSRPLSYGDPEAQQRLQIVLKSVCIRRTKQMKDNDGRPLVTLPPVSEYIHRFKLSPEEQAVYDVVNDACKKMLEKYAAEGTLLKNYSTVLVYLMRLRQICNSTTLCPKHVIEQSLATLSDEGDPSVKMDAAERERLQEVLKQVIASGDDCCVCFNALEQQDGRITPCAHCYCKMCIEQTIDTQGKCPLCRRDLTKGELIKMAAEATVEKTPGMSAQELLAASSSSKITELIKFLKATQKGVKSIVFSQWTGMLDLVEPALSRSHIDFCRFDGSMSRKHRDVVLEAFREPLSGEKEFGGRVLPNPVVMLISLQCGSLGLNLTSASQCFLLDPWWNESVERQARDRVNRLGQAKPVKVFSFVIEDSVEDKVLAIQARKREMIAEAFSGMKHRGDGAGGAREEVKQRVQDIREIFGMNAS